jgi:DNA-directed RNA polymerase specialized sigma24 family protein
VVALDAPARQRGQAAGGAAVAKADLLAQMPPLTAEVFRLKVEGYTYAEIAAMVDGVANAKAAENLVARERKRWRARRAG